MEDIDQQHLWPTTLTSSTMAANFNGAFQRQGFNQQFLWPPVGYSHEAALLGIEPTAQVESTQVKIELKEKIKTKYNGTELPQIEIKEPEPPKKKVKEDPEVVKKRRERNKIAATKCRKRKRERIEKLQQKTNKIRAEKRMLEEEKKQLQTELANLKLLFANHKCKRLPVISDESEFMNLLIQMTPPTFQSTSMGKHI